MTGHLHFRDLPLYGHKQWQTYFGRTFDVYTKLWKFQQQHRQVLDEVYGLKRWQIGEIASKIGQLYYHYYLRTSDTYYLQESFSFFSAIRTRDYFSSSKKEERAELAVKTLRYYARFIIVCLLLKKLRLVRDLTKEFSRHINDYAPLYSPEDQAEWNIVVQEIRDFVEADNICTVLSGESTPVVITNRLTPFNCLPPDKPHLPSKQLQLAEILIVGNCFDQIRFSELTLDMFRILQCLEHDTQDNFGNTPHPLSSLSRAQKSSENGSGSGIPNQSTPIPPQSSSPSEPRTPNPHKYLLYKPSFSQFNTFMAAGFMDLPSDGVLLLYISAEGIKPTSKSSTGGPSVQIQGYESGGVVTNSRREQDVSIKSKKARSREPHCIHPGDIYPYTRKPLFLIVDSNNSSGFKNFQSLFGQPVITLLSPETVPTRIENQRERGNLFTLFLYCPLTAYCYVCGLTSISLKTWERGQSIIDTFLGECSRILLRSRSLHSSFTHFLGVDFLRVFILRYCFCSMVLQLHRDFRGPSFYPACYPSPPESELMESQLLQKLFFDLATLFDSVSLFATASKSSALITVYFM
ncbi:unnamed protein product [Schistocephalus solidus]|uniref:Protein SCAI n=1 Tax=Schistocephalus solidus TaxID=70667 RepID=A0A183SZF6_SCHSO|nr:unnamed protein product [Schistocephalus solidus]